jgi:hypothetical protein
MIFSRRKLNLGYTLYPSAIPYWDPLSLKAWACSIELPLDVVLVPIHMDVTIETRRHANEEPMLTDTAGFSQTQLLYYVFL